MKPENRAKITLAITRSKAKMYEYRVPKEHHIAITEKPSDLFDLTIGLLGNLSALHDTNTNFTQENTITFSAHFFDAFQKSRLNPDFDAYLYLIGAATYYLSDMPGNAGLLAEKAPESFNLEANELDQFLRFLLMYKVELFALSDTKNPYVNELLSLSTYLKAFFDNGEEREHVLEVLKSLKEKAYAGGSDRELLFTDIIRAVICRMLKHSVWTCLPTFSGLAVDVWRYAIKKETFMRELWPSQLLLGRKGVLSGSSAVVQMPTSAGKTRAVELIIRSAFLSGRASLALIVVPYRALCHEIHSSFSRQFGNEQIEVEVASDVLQEDVTFSEKLQILILTPEKLEFLLRQNKDLKNRFELVIYDEGHLFNDPSRGVAYELLLTSLKISLPSNSQIVLISAVVENSEEILQWLIKNSGQVVQGGISLLPTYRSIAFSSWRDRLGRLEFVSPDDPNKNEFFVPRIIESSKLQKQGRERSVRYFPEKGESKDIALFLGFKLHFNGSVAIFAGRKDTAINTASRAVDVFNRNIQMSPPSELCDKEELNRLIYQHSCHFGDESICTKAAKLGIFTHHGTTPHGIRLSIEYALQQGSVRFVICTSTLAQGVNIPLRYIILTSLQQGLGRIKRQDFLNLIGRAGRAGMYTEGTVLFANPEVYDRRSSRRDRWRWKSAVELLNPSGSVPCSSQILTLFSPLKDIYGKEFIKLKSFQLCRLFFMERKKFNSLPDKIFARYRNKYNLDLNKLKIQLDVIAEILKSIEAFLLRYVAQQKEKMVDSVIELAQNTLAFAQGIDNTRDTIVKIFLFIAERIEAACTDTSKLHAYSKTILTLQECIELEQYILDHAEDIQKMNSAEEYFEMLWPVLCMFSSNKIIQNGEETALKNAGLRWIQGAPFRKVFKELGGTKIGNRWATIDHTVDLCEAGFGFQGSFIIGAVIELLHIVGINSHELIKDLRYFQKQMKYGLPLTSSIDVYELGLSDRCLAMEVSSILSINLGKHQVRAKIQEQKDRVKEIVNKYPKYFQLRLKEL